MKDEDLLRAIARAARRDPDRERAPRWERLASGEATDEERRALEAIAAEEGEPEAMRAMEPMADAVAARVTARLASGAKPAKVTRFPRAAAIAGVLALAAGVALVAGRARTTPGPLPEYAMLVTGGMRDSRGGPAPAGERVRLGRDSNVSIVMRPARDVEGPLEVHAAIVRAGRAERWAPPVTVSPTGVVTIAGPASSIVPGPAGPCDLVVAVGPAGEVPTDPSSIDVAVSGARLAVGRAHVDLVER